MDYPLPEKPPESDKKKKIVLKASHTTLGNLSHLVSLSTTQILAHAHQLLDLPLIDIGTPELKTLAESSKSPDPKGQPFDALASTQHKKAANCVHPIQMTLPE